MALVIITASVAAMVSHPRLDDKQPVDALFVLATVPERYDTAEQLMADGLAANILYSVAQQAPETVRSRCGPRTEFRVLCVVPEPNTTQGEAMALASIAQREGWNSVAILTFDTHITRARILATRCFHGDLHMLPIARETGTHARLREIAYEVVALAKASVSSTCDGSLPGWLQRSIDDFKHTAFS